MVVRKAYYKTITWGKGMNINTKEEYIMLTRTNSSNTIVNNQRLKKVPEIKY